MRKVILALAVSLDGFIEGPNGEYDWCFTDQDYGLTDFTNRVDTLFMGRKTYEMVQQMGGGGMPPMKEYVFSNTLKKLKDGAVLVTGDISKEVEKIKQSPGKDIWLFGGAALTASMMNSQLVDELQLAVHPILLGGGKPLFSGLNQKIALELAHSKQYSSGLITIQYFRKK